MNRNTLIALGGGGISAAASMAFLEGATGLALVVVYFAPLPLLGVGLGLGSMAGTLAGASGFLLAGLLGGAVPAGLYGLVHAVPAWLLVRLVLLQRATPDGGTEWYPIGAVLGWLSLFAVAMLGVAAIGTTGDDGGLRGTVAGYLERVYAALAPEVPADDRAAIAGVLVPLFPGMMGVSWLIMLVVNAVIAQALLARAGRNLRPSPRFSTLTVPDWLGWPLVAAAALALAGSGETDYAATNAAIVLALPYLFVGLGVMHLVVRRLPLSGPLLGVSYFVLVLTGLTGYLLLAGVGMVDQWFGVRRRITGPDDDEENG